MHLGTRLWQGFYQQWDSLGGKVAVRGVAYVICVLAVLFVLPHARFSCLPSLLLNLTLLQYLASVSFDLAVPLYLVHKGGKQAGRWGGVPPDTTAAAVTAVSPGQYLIMLPISPHV